MFQGPVINPGRHRDPVLKWTMAVELTTQGPICLCLPDLRDACLTNIAEKGMGITRTMNDVAIAGEIETGSNLVAWVDARHAGDPLFLDLLDRVYSMLHVVSVDAPGTGVLSTLQAHHGSPESERQAACPKPSDMR